MGLQGENRRARQSERLPREALALALALVERPTYVVDDTGHILFWNLAAERLYGFTASEAIDHAYPVLLGTEDGGAAALAAMERARRLGRAEHEAARTAKDGTRYLVRVEHRVLRPSGDLVLITDHTIVQSEAALWAGLLGARVEVFDAVPEPIFITGADDVIIIANAAAAALTGFSSSELTARPLSTVVTLVESDTHEWPFSGDGRPVARAAFVRTKRGQPRLVKLIGHQVSTVRGPLRICSCWEMSPTTAADESVIHAAAVIQRMHLGFIAFEEPAANDDDHRRGLRLVSLNPTAERLLQISASEALGKSVDAVFPDLRATGLVDEYLQVIDEGLEKDFENFAYGDDRVPRRLWSFRAVPLPQRRLGVVFSDNTEKRRTEDELQRSATELEKLVADKEQLLRELHHRVKNNLQVAVSMMRLQARSSHRATVSEVLEDTERRLRAMALVHEMLYAGSGVTQVRLASYARALLTQFISAYAPVGIRGVVDIRDEEVVAIEVAVPLGLILTELISNACKHAFPETADGQPRRAAPTITIATTLRESELRLTVADNGRGLRGLDFATTESFGLSLVRDLCRQLQAQCAFEVGDGTCFTITLPRHAPGTLPRTTS